MLSLQIKIDLQTGWVTTYTRPQGTKKARERGGVGVRAAEPAGTEGIAVNHRYSAESKVGDNPADPDPPSPWDNKIWIPIGPGKNQSLVRQANPEPAPLLKWVTQPVYNIYVFFSS